MDIEFDFESGSAPADLIESLDGFLSAFESELESAMQDIVLKIEADAKQNAPVDTGNLRASIEGVVEEIGEAAARGAVGTNVEYAIHQEFGTIYQSAQPFLRPALDSNKDYIVSRFEEAVENAEAQVT